MLIHPGTVECTIVRPSLGPISPADGLSATGFVVGLAPNQKSPQAADSLTLDFVIRNTADRSLHVMQSYPEADILLDVVGPDGLPLGRRPEQQFIVKDRNLPVEFKSGEASTFKYSFSRIYELRKIGKYTITPRHMFFRLDGSGDVFVQGQPFTITVGSGGMVTIANPVARVIPNPVSIQGQLCISAILFREETCSI